MFSLFLHSRQPHAGFQENPTPRRFHVKKHHGNHFRCNKFHLPGRNWQHKRNVVHRGQECTRLVQCAWELVLDQLADCWSTLWRFGCWEGFVATLTFAVQTYVTRSLALEKKYENDIYKCYYHGLANTDFHNVVVCHFFCGHVDGVLILYTNLPL